MELFGSESDFGVLVAVGTATAACILFVISQNNSLRKEMDEKIASAVARTTWAEQEASRKIGVVHARVDTVEGDVKSLERHVSDHVIKLWQAIP